MCMRVYVRESKVWKDMLTATHTKTATDPPTLIYTCSFASLRLARCMLAGTLPPPLSRRQTNFILRFPSMARPSTEAPHPQVFAVEPPAPPPRKARHMPDPLPQDAWPTKGGKVHRGETSRAPLSLATGSSSLLTSDCTFAKSRLLLMLVFILCESHISAASISSRLHRIRRLHAAPVESERISSCQQGSAQHWAGEMVGGRVYMCVYACVCMRAREKLCVCVWYVCVRV